MSSNEPNRDNNATLWSIVIKAAYRKRRSKRKSENSDKKSNNCEDELLQNNDNLSQNLNNDFSNNNIKNNNDELLKFLFDKNNSNNSDNSNNNNMHVDNGINNNNIQNNNNSTNNNFLNELFSIDKLNNNSGSKLSLDCKGEIILEENSLNNNGKQMDWLGLMEGRVYINENMAGTSLQPYSGAYKRTKGKRWSTEQTEKFYDALSLFGTDLMLVKSVFPEFTDKQIHDKFKTEEKRNKDKLDNILLNNKKKLTKEDIDKFKLKYNKV